ncbi:metallophosphoesterase [Halapricum hydrolyticum]|uniref:Metallophosphoesterase n=1 Tax=Halapricum hydrolyticum TaxID=2979991 RepID=A0AAE3IGZ7_9EURY|nr:metallophosphoesterase [Halapricum hydrolyticum]MCU4719338.1 metallophosphoesterase [Halapricum hydrolyticum]MCU4728210.1 metallophosphoesterase [Halapricum hydrolyticum]
MADVYYFISDLHIGGDEQLQQVDFLDELLEFLTELEESDEDTELIINGDAFGLWEFTEVEGPAKFDALLDHYPELFDQLEVTGREVPITLIPGNHDYELAAYPEYVERLAEYNVTLEQEVSIERTVGDSVVHVEHGMQEDPNNRIPDFGNPYANPPGYFVNRQITSRAGQLSERGKYNWLKDIQAVTPMTEIPDWLISNYFYREMSAWLRFSVVPFLFLFNIGVLYVAIFALAWFEVWSFPLTLVEEALGFFGPAGRLVELVLAGNLVIIVLILAISIPLAVFVWDARKTLRRFGLVRSPTDREPVEKYLDRARDVFASEPRVAVYVYGHTHRPSATEVNGRLVINTGTWLKRLQRVDPLLGVLPPVYYASYQLNYFRLSAADDGDVLVEYDVIEKPNPDDETWLQRLLTRSPRRQRELPDKTVVNRPRERGLQLDESEVTE